MLQTSLADLALRYDRSSLAGAFEAAEKQRRAIIEQFPLETMAELPLERYALRDQNRGTLCYLLEFGSPDLGSMKGGSADKLGIYFHKKTNQWKSAIPGHADPQEAWTLLRADLVRAVELARAGRWQEIDELPVARYVPAVRTKWLHVHFPGEVMRIYSLGHLMHYIRKLGGQFARGSGYPTAAANRELVQLLRAVPEMKDWSLWEIGHMLYEWAPPDDFKVPSIADFAAGFDRESLRGEVDKAEAYRRHIEALFPREELPALEMERFASAADGSDRLTNLMYRDKTALNAIRGSGFSSSAIHCSKDGVYRSALGNPDDPGGDWLRLRQALVTCCDLAAQGKWEEIDQVADANKAAALRTKLLQAYFPGEVLPIYAQRHLEHYLKRLKIAPLPGQRREAATVNRLILDHLRSNPALADWHPIELGLLLKAWAPFKDAEAGGENADPQTSEPAAFTTMDSLNQIFYGPPGTGKTYGITRHAARLISGSHLTDEEARRQFDQGCRNGRIRICTFHPSFGYEDFVEGIRPVMDKQAQGSRFEMRSGIFKALATEALFACLEPVTGRDTAPVLSKADERESIVQAYLAEGSSSGWQLRADRDFPPFVLIIDEINRGNISRIFGELITLIEEDKRHSAANALTVTLPSSQQLFAVPPNLHLLGTMNTADKSLALLDIALRRRFEFTELAPDFARCPQLPQPMRDVLTAVNERLERCKDRDHRIGHAFFMEVSDAASFNQVFRRKVVPLLQEYFFNDADGARYVLGEELSANGRGFLRPLPGSSRWQRNRWRWFADEDPEMDCWARLQQARLTETAGDFAFETEEDPA